ncbi:M14 family zinc carboxypeptidase [Streptomyces sp. NPDC002779]|uniref:M14 family zinc carboxypeptidase n=1 Tax=Streptomyces sp. NPDC002779 TaxID=3364664 RepID=UPI003673EA46
MSDSQKTAEPVVIPAAPARPEAYDPATRAALEHIYRQAVRAVADGRSESTRGLYATSGTSDDYAYSRHLTNPAATKVFSYTIECGDSFQPGFNEAEQVIREVSAALLALALNAPTITTSA